MSAPLLPGTIFVVRTGSGWVERLIRLGAALRDQPNLVNHVAIFTHYQDGVPWGIEGKPGGVGDVDMRRYIKSGYTSDNSAQPISDVARERIASRMAVVKGTPYDWQAIAADAYNALSVSDMFAGDWKGHDTVPGHVVCSSLAAYLYWDAGLPHPSLGHERYCSPADWAEFIINKAWSTK